MSTRNRYFFAIHTRQKKEVTKRCGRVQTLHAYSSHSGCTSLELLNLISCRRPRNNSCDDRVSKQRDEFAGPLNAVIYASLWFPAVTSARSLAQVLYVFFATLSSLIVFTVKLSRQPSNTRTISKLSDFTSTHVLVLRRHGKFVRIPFFSNFISIE